jgi:hypothetical protein
MLVAICDKLWIEGQSSSGALRGSVSRMGEDRPIPVHVHGLNNQVAPFDGGKTKLFVGGLAGPSYAGSEECVLLTVEGTQNDGRVFDIEIAVPISRARELMGLILDRAGTGD